MTTTQPTVEDFLAQHDPEEDTEEAPFAGTVITGATHTLPSDPLESIADSLRQMAAVLQADAVGNSIDTVLREDHDQLREEYLDVEGDRDRLKALVTEIVAICKPSTSKLADRVRAAVNAHVAETVEPEDEVLDPADAPPAPDADVEDWRGYARSKGYTGPDVDNANRSQIRTMLGLSHTDPTTS